MRGLMPSVCTNLALAVGVALSGIKEVDTGVVGGLHALESALCAMCQSPVADRVANPTIPASTWPPYVNPREGLVTRAIGGVKARATHSLPS